MIDGNVWAEIQIKTTSKNEIGESAEYWQTVDKLWGWLDLQSGDSKYTNYDTKMQESTHIFVADYKVLDKRIKAENSRLTVNGEIYDIMLIDNPMNLNKQLEIYLKYTGC